MNHALAKKNRAGAKNKIVDKEKGRGLFFNIVRAETEHEFEARLTRFQSEYPDAALWVRGVQNRVSHMCVLHVCSRACMHVTSTAS